MMHQKYQKAECFLPWHLQKTVFNSTIFPYWSDDALYYFQQSSVDAALIRIDYKSGKKEKVIDFQKIVTTLSNQLKQDIHSEDLPLDIFYIQENPKRLCFSYQNKKWSYDFEKNICLKEDDLTSGHLFSPDKNWAVFLRDHNLVLNDIKNQLHHTVTKDGEHYHDYASSPETNTRTVTNRLKGSIQLPVAMWSPDSKKVITHKLDQKKVKSLYLLQNAPPGSQRPTEHIYRMSFSGDENLPLAKLVILDVATKEMTWVKTNEFLSPYLTPIEFKWVWWSNDSKKVYFLQETRSSKELQLCVVDSATGISETLISENSNTYVEPSQLFLWPRQIIILEDKREIIWLSERSGYAHLYLYAIGSNIPKHPITQGEWCVRDVHFYDEDNNWLYFTACGYDKSIDPYYKQLFRCRIDGCQLECLTEENANHSINISPTKKFFLDTYSTINTAPISLLRSIDGKISYPAEIADLSGLDQLNWIPPQRVALKARDGVTTIYGNLYFPSHFDSNKKYPLIDHIYPGPQVYRTSPHFSLYGLIFRSTWIAQSLAELGFIVLHIDGFGTPGRSKAFHDATYKNMSDCGIPDHVVAIQQLAEKYNFIDIDKIGITGYSGGGYAAVRAMLMYPDFYKVAVAAGGNHDLRCYPASYGEKYNSLDTSTYESQSNAAYAEKLQGKLFLIHGEMDDNVHPCATLQLVDALIKHDKDFDMLIMPNQNHRSTFDHPYYTRKLWNYFVENLLGEKPPKNRLIKSIPQKFPQIIDW